MSDPKHIPIAVRSPHKATTTEIDWADGHTAIYPHDVLRGYCPCATCQGHSGTIAYRPGGELMLSTIEQVGDYALSLGWADGHNTGIYSYRYLRELCQCAACVTARGPAAPAAPPR